MSDFEAVATREDIGSRNGNEKGRGAKGVDLGQRPALLSAHWAAGGQ
jgi:hypothetical protein